MNGFEIRVTSDLLRPEVVGARGRGVCLCHGDAKAHSVVVDVVRGGAAVDLTGFTAAAYVQYGSTKYQLNSCVISGNRITAVIDAAVYANASGLVTIVVKVVNSTTMTDATVAVVMGVIEKFISDGVPVVPTANAWTSAVTATYLAEMKEAVDTFETMTAQMNANIALIDSRSGVRTVNMLDMTRASFWVRKNWDLSASTNCLMSPAISVNAGDVIRLKHFGWTPSGDTERYQIKLFAYKVNGDSPVTDTDVVDDGKQIRIGYADAGQGDDIVSAQYTIPAGIKNIRVRFIRNGGSSQCTTDQMLACDVLAMLTVNETIGEYVGYDYYFSDYYADANTRFEYVEEGVEDANDRIDTVEESAEDATKKATTVFCRPTFGNGTLNNFGNSNAIALTEIQPTYGAEYIQISVNKDPDDGYYWEWHFWMYAVDSGISQGNKTGHENATVKKTITKVNSFTVSIDESAKGFAVCLLMTNGTTDKCIQTDEYKNGAITVVRRFSEIDDAYKNSNDIYPIGDARHVYTNNTKPLTLMHFTDIHADTDALKRIMYDASKYSSMIDDYICTGDMVATYGGAIDSWWDGRVMTCIGNHDSAVVEGSTYKWTDVSVAQRIAWYISPFENKWGITRPSGKTYYYKDYTVNNVRLIVLDSMLYNYTETDTSLGTAQTTWLGGLLDSAITSGIHVLIASHAPCENSKVVNCSFSKYGQTALSAAGVSSLPNSIKTLVRDKINEGLNLVGYIVGHTHQDNVWDAMHDGTQLQFCPTCAAVSYAPQWQDSDQYRDEYHDAYNLFTVDTVHKLVKIIRCGGANMDDHMRPRRQICFSYADGSCVSE